MSGRNDSSPLKQGAFWNQVCSSPCKCVDTTFGPSPVVITVGVHPPIRRQLLSFFTHKNSFPHSSPQSTSRAKLKWKSRGPCLLKAGLE